MIGRVGRLVRAEFVKLVAHPFLYLALGIVAAIAFLSEWLQPGIRGQTETVWRPLHAVQLFVYGFDLGLLISAFVLLIFSSMMFSGEFDRGTIKNLLTRPITRGDLFAAKCVTVAALACFLYAFLLYVSLFWALLWGDLGPVWAHDHPIIMRDTAEIVGHARKAVLMCFLPFLAVGFLGVFVSNWTESSGYSVAVALVLFIFAYFGMRMLLREPAQQQFFFYYPGYAMDKLRTYAEGANTSWDKEVDEKLLFVKVPLAYVAVFVPLAYGVFRARNITA